MAGLDWKGAWRRIARTAPGSAAAKEYAHRLQRLTPNEEVAVLDAILTRGIDQGWVCRPNPADIIPMDESSLDIVFAASEGRNRGANPESGDPFPTSDYPVDAIEGEADAYVVISQRCDLVRSLALEPLVELARCSLARSATQRELIDQAKRNSPRFLYLAAHEDGAWVVDLRRRVFLAKDRLKDEEGTHVIGLDRDRRRFILRIGQRFSRTPIPDDFMPIQRALIKCLKSGTNQARGEHFTEFIGYRADSRARVLAVIAPGRPRQVADDAWNAIYNSLPPEVQALIVEDDSGAFEIEELSFWMWLQSFKLDLDEVTFSSKAGGGQEPPTH